MALRSIWNGTIAFAGVFVGKNTAVQKKARETKAEATEIPATQESAPDKADLARAGDGRRVGGEWA